MDLFSPSSSSGDSEEMSPFPQPPGTPTLTALTGQEEGDAGEGLGGGIVKAGFAVNSMLDLIARSYPRKAAELDRIKGALKGIIAEIVQTGKAPGQGDDEAAEGEMGMMPMQPPPSMMSPSGR